MMNENNKTQEQGSRFDYMNQKPQHNRKAFAALGIFVSAAVLLVICLSIYGVSYAKEHAGEIAQSPYGWIVAGLIPDLTETEEDTEKIFAGTNMSEPGGTSEVNQILNVLTTSDYDHAEDEPNLPDAEAKDLEDSDNEVPEYTEEPIVLALYKVEDDTVVTTSSDEEHAGYYVLDPGTVYAIRWDASPLYRNDDEKVDANIEINSDFLIGGGIDGEGVITVNIRDHHRHIDYVGELHVDVDGANLGIEFCAKQCRIHAYGFNPEIRDGKFTVCFYTSGEYVERVYSGISDADGYYRYTYSVNGGEYLNDAVTQPEGIVKNNPPRPMPHPDVDPLPDPMPVPPTTPTPPAKEPVKEPVKEPTND